MADKFDDDNIINTVLDWIYKHSILAIAVGLLIAACFEQKLTCGIHINSKPTEVEKSK